MRGVLILALLWWAWTGYAWLANVSDVEEPPLKLTIWSGCPRCSCSRCASPRRSRTATGGLDGPLVLALAYLLVRAMHFVMFWLVAREDPTLRGQLARFAPSVAGSSIVLVVASQTHGRTQTALWALALVVDYVGTWLGGASGWRLPSPGHFSERHGLIVIIALGESIVAIGVGVAELPITWPILVASALGLLARLRDVVGLLRRQRPPRRARAGHRARGDPGPSGAHGVLLRAPAARRRRSWSRRSGMKKVLEYVGDTEKHDLSDPLKGVALGALVGGVAVYLARTRRSSSGWSATHGLDRSGSGRSGSLLALWVPIKGVSRPWGSSASWPGSWWPRCSSSPWSTPRAAARSAAS